MALNTKVCDDFFGIRNDSTTSSAFGMIHTISSVFSPVFYNMSLFVEVTVDQRVFKYLFNPYLIFVTNITNGVCGEKICHVEKIFHMTNCHVEKFLHLTNIQLEICLYMVNKEKNHVNRRNVE